MKQDTNAFNKHKMLLYSFVSLILIAMLLYATFGKAGSRFLSSLDCLASAILKIALTYFLIEVALLHRHRRQSPHRLFAKKQKGKRNTAVSVTKKSSEEAKKIPPTSPAFGFMDTQIDKLQPLDYDLHYAGASVLKEPVYDQDEKHADSLQQLSFSFQDSDLSTRVALDIIDGIRQGQIILTPADKGEVTGREIMDGQYSVYPSEDCLTETELRYSPVAACFEINGSTCTGQQVKVSFDKPAILTKIEGELYKIAEKGLLTVISTID